ncbi:hypothetical protein NKR23_g6709 [Pleurostoma richardsiae]|uniref:Uncharacterized protein n=1 Tax=Pleurostoma richardsiae TaxID=41990 RepID=A0AA38RV06_9PEZI|nr:hypothetical protein NKR23_g6709 [Pleurostoma richardsiae]
MNATLTRAVAPAPWVWCASPVDSLLTRAYRLLFWVAMLLVPLELHQNITIFALTVAITYLSPAAVLGALIGSWPKSALAADIFALPLTLQHAVTAIMLCLLFLPRQMRLKHVDLRPFYSFWCQFIFVPRMVMQYVSLPKAARLGDLVVPATCDAAGLCTNPCANVNARPVIWEMGSPLEIERLWTTNEWLAHASEVDGAGYHAWLRIMRLSYYMLGPLFQFVLINSNAPLRETRNRIFLRLRQDYYPKTRGCSWRMRVCIRLLVWARYACVLLRAASMDIRVIQGAIRLVVWAGERILKAKMVSFEDLVVLREDPSRQRYKTAKHLAALWYFWALSFYILFPAYTIYVTTSLERSIWGWIPESQSIHEFSQWIGWAVVGLPGAAAVLWYLAFNIIPGLFPRRQSGKGKEKIYVSGPVFEMDELERIALIEKSIADDPRDLQRRLTARVLAEWYDFKYWWKNPVGASVEERRQHNDDPWLWDEPWRRGGERGDEIQHWATLPEDIQLTHRR